MAVGDIPIIISGNAHTLITVMISLQRDLTTSFDSTHKRLMIMVDPQRPLSLTVESSSPLTVDQSGGKAKIVLDGQWGVTIGS
jgi:hypothetical protein